MYLLIYFFDNVDFRVCGFFFCIIILWIFDIILFFCEIDDSLCNIIKNVCFLVYFKRCSLKIVIFN